MFMGIEPMSRCYIDDPTAFKWETPDWTPPPFDSYIIYEMHVGSFTPEGTFASAMEKLQHLADTGFTCVQVQPAHSGT
jgi:maltooligosyltrehalose trehalohydrolase